MNKVIIMGRITHDIEVKEGKVLNFYVAVRRRFAKEGSVDVDYINCAAFGKQGDFIGQYFKKGQMISLVGRLQVSSWLDKENKKQWKTAVVVEEVYFTGSKEKDSKSEEFAVCEEDEDLPF